MSRSQAFGEGMAGGQQEFGSPSLVAQANRYNAQVPKAYRPSGALNGIGIEQYKETLGGSFPTDNGSSESTYSTKRYFAGNGA
jgi:hypothetical protein